MTENPGYCSGSFDGLHHSSDEDDDDLVDIAGATLDFSSMDDVPPLSSGTVTLDLLRCAEGEVEICGVVKNTCRKGKSVYDEGLSGTQDVQSCDCVCAFRPMNEARLDC